MDVVFCGTPRFAVPALRSLVESGFNVRLVVSQPDRPAGRGLSVIPTAVKRFAVEHGLPVTQPEKIKNNDELRARLEALAPEAIIVVAYGRIIPQWMLDLPPLGNINVHASLLPKYRGAAPIQWAIAMGETVTGITTMRLDAGLDTGDMLLKHELPILPEDTYEAFLSAPVIARNRVVGVINVQHRSPHQHTGGEMEMLTTVGEQVGCLLVLARMEPTAVEAANHVELVLSSGTATPSS
jgi:methionyl-tRNA formyltransferase